MKRFVFFLFYIAAHLGLAAQSDISVTGIDFDPQSGKYTVSFRDNSNPRLSDHNSTAFTWYLSYRGKRVSDYFFSNSSGRWNFSQAVFPWPDEIPAGCEKYVTAQIGREPTATSKDRRDDD